jgi:hypothetical protein
MLILLFFGPFEDLGGMVSEFFFEVGEDAVIVGPLDRSLGRGGRIRWTKGYRSRSL